MTFLTFFHNYFFFSFFICIFATKREEMEPKGMFVVEGEPEIVKETRARILTAFQDITFDEPTHTYTLNGKTLPSVTTVLHKFMPPFDGETIASNYAEKHGMTKEYWLDEWKINSLKSTITGTLVHEFGESLFYLRSGHPERITASCVPKYEPKKNWLIPTRPKEEAIQLFYKELHPNLHLLLPEARMFTGLNKDVADLKQDVAGTSDILFYYIDPDNPEKNGICIFDYKTNRSLENKYSRNNGKMLLPPFDDMVAEDQSIYTLQLSTYSIPLEEIGLNVIALRLVWLTDDGMYHLIPLKNISDRIKQIL